MSSGQDEGTVARASTFMVIWRALGPVSLIPSLDANDRAIAEVRHQLLGLRR